MPVIPVGTGTYFSIESELSPSFSLPPPPARLVIEIGAKPEHGPPPLKINKQKSPPTDNQLWTLTGGPIANYYFIQSKTNDPNGNPLAIDVSLEKWTPQQGTKIPGIGTPLDAWTRKATQAGSGEDVFNQLWCFYPGGEGGWYFINTLMSVLNGLVIDVPKSDSSNPLQVYSQKSPAAKNQLWRFIDEHGNAWTPPPPPRSTGT